MQNFLRKGGPIQNLSTKSGCVPANVTFFSSSFFLQLCHTHSTSMSTASHASFSGCNIHTLSSIINHKSPEALELIIQKAHCRVRTDRGQAWYTVGKIMAERKAWEIAERTGLDVISILPAMCYGPNLQKEVSPSNITMLPLFHGMFFFRTIYLQMCSRL